MKTSLHPIDILKRLVDQAECFSALSRSVNYAHKTQRERIEDAKNVGQLILRSSPQSRELLQALTSNDTANVRWPRFDYIHGSWDAKTYKFIPDQTYRYGRKRAVCVSMSQ